jgi:hypothetical protein
MTYRNAIPNWLVAWREIAGYDDVPGYRQLPWLQRKKLDHVVLWRGFWSEGFWRAFFVVLTLVVLALIICWHWDLAGWRRDLLRCCPPLGAIPWLAAARKRHLRALLDPGGEPS